MFEIRLTTMEKVTVKAFRFDMGDGCFRFWDANVNLVTRMVAAFPVSSVISVIEMEVENDGSEDHALEPSGGGTYL